MGADDVVRTDEREGTLVITIERPEARNAINKAVAEAVAAALDALEERSDLVVGVLTGAGGMFSAGMDLKAAMRGERPVVEGRGLAGLTEAPPSKPLIAAVEGWALGGGCELALACDLVVAAEGARFGLPEVKRGLLAAGGGLFRLPNRIPYQVAMEIALTGDPVSARRGYEVGLVNRLAADGAALDEALALAASIAVNAPLAVTASKRIVAESRDWPSTEAFARQRPIAEAVRSSEDAEEGPRAFAEKRAPQWKGR